MDNYNTANYDPNAIVPIQKKQTNPIEDILAGVKARAQAQADAFGERMRNNPPKWPSADEPKKLPQGTSYPTTSVGGV